MFKSSRLAQNHTEYETCLINILSQEEQKLDFWLHEHRVIIVIWKDWNRNPINVQFDEIPRKIKKFLLRMNFQEQMILPGTTRSITIL